MTQLKAGTQQRRRALGFAGAGLGLLLLQSCSDSRADESPSAAPLLVEPERETCEDNAYLAECEPPPPADPSASLDQGEPAPLTPGGVPLAEVPTSNSGDSYESVGTNPFVMVDHDPLSTFAVDVDTASYDVFRRDVEDGILPQPASVRLEEYVNYFSYAYTTAPADASIPFTINLAAGPSPLDAQRTLLRVGIQGKAAPPPGQKRPTNLVFLVDTSGSMNDVDRLPLAQQVLRQTLELLEPTDQVSIVSYAGDTQVRLEPTAASDRDRIITEISELSSSGGTNGASGINLAYEQAEQAFIEGGINHVVLCTDGDFNVGTSSTAELVELIREKRQTGITFTALGFGRGNLNDSMLEAISNAGNGFYGVISSETQAAEYVDERMLSTLSLIARDMKVQVEFNPGLVSAYRLLGYENRAIADESFRDDVVDAGEIGAGHRVTALYELVLSGAAVPDIEGAPEPTTGAAYAGAREVASSDLVQVKIRYKHIDDGTEDPALEVAHGLAPGEAEGTDADLAWASAMAAFAEVLKDSPYASSVDLDAVGAVFEAQSDRDPERAEFYELFLVARGML